MSTLQVELVAADRKVWEGEADMVLARSVDGELGHPARPHAAARRPRLRRRRSSTVRAASRRTTIDSGFISVDHDRVTIIAESVGAAGQSLTGRVSRHTPMPTALLSVEIAVAVRARPPGGLPRRDVCASPGDLPRRHPASCPCGWRPNRRNRWRLGHLRLGNTRLEWFSLLGVSAAAAARLGPRQCRPGAPRAAPTSDVIDFMPRRRARAVHRPRASSFELALSPGAYTALRPGWRLAPGLQRQRRLSRHSARHVRARSGASARASRRGRRRAATARRRPDRQVGDPGEDEQQVGEPVEVGRGQPVDPAVALRGARLVAVGGDGGPGAALGPPDDRRRDVQVGGAGRAAGQDERAQLLDPLEVAVAVGLELVDPRAASTRSGGYS